MNVLLGVQVVGEEIDETLEILRIISKTPTTESKFHEIRTEM